MRIKPCLTLLSSCASTTALAAEVPDEVNRAVMQTWGACMAASHSKEARELVAASSIFPDSDAKLRLVHGDCLPLVDPGISRPMLAFAHLSVRGGFQSFRYAAAEGLLTRQFKRSSPSIAVNAPALMHPSIPAGSPPPRQWTWGLPAWTKHVETSQRDASDSAFGECVVRYAPRESWALLKSRIGSEAESGAFSALKPSLARCLAKNGRMPVGKFKVRGSIALNLYRLAMPQAAERTS